MPAGRVFCGLGATFKLSVWETAPASVWLGSAGVHLGLARTLLGPQLLRLSSAVKCEMTSLFVRVPAFPNPKGVCFSPKLQHQTLCVCGAGADSVFVEL